MKKVKYNVASGGTVEVEYDEKAPCTVCGLPVVAASMGGTKLCSWCDTGVYRDGEKWTVTDLFDKDRIQRRAYEKSDVGLS